MVLKNPSDFYNKYLELKKLKKYDEIIEDLFSNLDQIFDDKCWDNILSSDNTKLKKESIYYGPYCLNRKKLYAKDKKNNYTFKIIESAPVPISSYSDDYYLYHEDFIISILKINDEKEDIDDSSKKIVTAIGLNPSGESNVEDEIKEWKDHAYEKDCLETTRKNTIKKILNLLKNDNDLKYFIQVDLYPYRSKKANEVNQSTSNSLNLKVIDYWLNKSDIIIPAWGSKGPILNKIQTKKELKQFDHLIEKLFELQSNKNNVYKLEPNDPNSHQKAYHFASPMSLSLEKWNPKDNQ